MLDFYESTIAKIVIDNIIVGKRLRNNFSQIKIDNLAESIEKIGLLNPITINKNKTLIAGYHRLEACKKLGWIEIPCVITTINNPLLLKLLEIDENLIRYELHFIERGQHLKERKKIYEELNPETKLGADFKIYPRDSNGHIIKPREVSTTLLVKSFVEDTAEKVGVSESTIKQEIQIAENIIPEVQEFIQKKEISKTDALKIARMPKEDQIKIKETIESGKADNKYIENVYAKVKKEKKPRKIVELPKDKYDIIYADPAWKYEGGTDSSRIIENQYPTMDTEDICKIEVPSAKDAILFLWVTSPKLEEGLQVVNMWGFEYKTSMVWVKDHIGMGYYARGRHEFLLIATKGSPGVPEPADRPDSVIEDPRTEHSKKPEIVYDLIEKMYPNRKYLELFARNKREKWQSWGDEV